MKPNDIVMIYTDPMKCKQPEGQAKLKRLIASYTNAETWIVEFIDGPGMLYTRLIKKP